MRVIWEMLILSRLHLNDLTSAKDTTEAKEHVQLRFGVQKLPVF